MVSDKEFWEKAFLIAFDGIMHKSPKELGLTGYKDPAMEDCLDDCMNYADMALTCFKYKMKELSNESIKDIKDKKRIKQNNKEIYK